MGEDADVVVGTRYRIQSKIGCGSFGEIYTAADMENGQQLAAKAERSDAKHPQLDFENRVYGRLPPTIGFPRIYWFGTSGRCNVLVMERLGPSLETLFTRCSRRFSLRTVCKIALQLIDRLRHLHENNYIHRDLKPDNFLIGLGPKKKNTIFMIDMGLCKKYRDDNGEHIEYRENKRLTGTPRYASLASHKGSEQSRRDDLESLGYILVYFMKGKLPWMGLKARDKQEKYDVIGNKKKEVMVTELCGGIPAEFGEYLESARRLNFRATPDYDSLKEIFARLMKKHAFREEDQFDWEENNVDHLDLNPTGKNPQIQLQTLQIRPAPQPVRLDETADTGGDGGNHRAPGGGGGGGGVIGGGNRRRSHRTDASPRASGHRHHPVDVTRESPTHGPQQQPPFRDRSTRHSPAAHQYGGHPPHPHHHGGGGSPSASYRRNSTSANGPGGHRGLPPHPHGHHSSYQSDRDPQQRTPVSAGPPSFQYKARRGGSQSRSRSQSHSRNHAPSPAPQPPQQSPPHPAAAAGSPSLSPGNPSRGSAPNRDTRRQQARGRVSSSNNGPTPVIDLSSETSASPPPPVAGFKGHANGSSVHTAHSSSRLPSQPRASSRDADGARHASDSNKPFPAPQKPSPHHSSNKRKGGMSSSRSPRRKKPALSPAHDSSDPQRSPNSGAAEPRHQQPSGDKGVVAVIGVKRSRDSTFSHEHDAGAQPPDSKKYVTAARYEESQAERARLDERCRELTKRNAELLRENAELKEKLARVSVSASSSSDVKMHPVPAVDAGAVENESARANQGLVVDAPTPSSMSTVENLYDPHAQQHEQATVARAAGDGPSTTADPNNEHQVTVAHPQPHRVPSPIDLDKNAGTGAGAGAGAGPPTGPGPGAMVVRRTTPPSTSSTPPSPLPLPSGIAGSSSSALVPSTAQGPMQSQSPPSHYQSSNPSFAPYTNQPPPPTQRPPPYLSASSPLPSRTPHMPPHPHSGSPQFSTPPLPSSHPTHGHPGPGPGPGHGRGQFQPPQHSGYPTPAPYNANPYSQPPPPMSPNGPGPGPGPGPHPGRWAAGSRGPPPPARGPWRGGRGGGFPPRRGPGAPVGSRFPPAPHGGGGGGGGGGPQQPARSAAYFQSRMGE